MYSGRPRISGTASGQRALSRYGTPSSATPKFFTVFLLFALADGYVAVAPQSDVGQVGAGLGICVALMPSVEITATMLAVLATFASAVAFTGEAPHVRNVMAVVSIIAALTLGRLIGRVVFGVTHRGLAAHLGVWLALAATVQFLISPAGDRELRSAPRRRPPSWPDSPSRSPACPCRP